MVGGTVIEVQKRPDKYRVWCMDRNGDECAVYVEPTPFIKEGDKIWWQSGKVYWTPQGSEVGDVMVFKKIGFSFDPRESESK